MLLNLILLILFIIVLIGNSNIIEGQAGPEVPDEPEEPEQGDNVMNLFPGFLQNEVVLYEKKHNDDRKEVYLSSFFDSKGLYNGLEEEEEEQYKVVNQPDIKKECLDDSKNINNEFITEMVNKYKKQNGIDHNSNIKTNNYKDFDLNLFGMDLNFNLNDSVSNNDGDNNPTNDDDPINEYHNICELPSILYDENASLTDRIIINNKYGDCFDVDSQLYSKCRKSCYEATSSRIKGEPYVHHCSGYLVGHGDTSDEGEYNCSTAISSSIVNASMVWNNDHYIKHSGGYYTQCIPSDINTSAIRQGPISQEVDTALIENTLYNEIPCKPYVCHGSSGECDQANNVDDYYIREYTCNNTYYADETGKLNYQCIMDVVPEQEQAVCTQQKTGTYTDIKDCIPANKSPQEDYNRCYKESSKYIVPNKDDTDYIVTLF